MRVSSVRGYARSTFSSGAPVTCGFITSERRRVLEEIQPWFEVMVSTRCFEIFGLRAMRPYRYCFGFFP